MNPIRVAGDISEISNVSPTALRIIIGTRLRRLREAATVTAEDAGFEIRASNSKISRLELGKTRFKLRDVNDLLTRYGVGDDAERAELLWLAELANRPSWWAAYDEIIPAWFDTYLGFEQTASIIRSYNAQFVPALLQAPGYIRAAIRLGNEDASDEEIDRRVEFRMKRQQILHRPDPVKLWVILDEAVLLRPVGDPPSMRAQLQHLLDIAELPNVTIQLLSFLSGGHPAAGGPFSILRFRESEIPDMVYLEHLATASHYDKPADFDRYWEVMNRLTVHAEHPDITLAILDRIRQASC